VQFVELVGTGRGCDERMWTTVDDKQLKDSGYGPLCDVRMMMLVLVLVLVLLLRLVLTLSLLLPQAARHWLTRNFGEEVTMLLLLLLLVLLLLAASCAAAALLTLALAHF